MVTSDARRRRRPSRRVGGAAAPSLRGARCGHGIRSLEQTDVVCAVIPSSYGGAAPGLAGVTGWPGRALVTRTEPRAEGERGGQKRADKSEDVPALESRRALARASGYRMRLGWLEEATARGGLNG